MKQRNTRFLREKGKQISSSVIPDNESAPQRQGALSLLIQCIHLCLCMSRGLMWKGLKWGEYIQFPTHIVSVIIRKPALP